MASKSIAKFGVTVGCVVFGYIEKKGIQVCLIKRTQEPYLGMWTLPGGFIRDEEKLKEAVLRELKYDTGIRKVELKQFHAFSSEKEKHITVAYYGLVNTQNQTLMASVKEKNASWFSVNELPNLAFGQKKMVREAFSRMRMDTITEPIFRKMLGTRFTLLEVQNILEDIFDCAFDKSNFRKKIQKAELFKKTGSKKIGVGYNEPELFEFNRSKVTKKALYEVFGYAALMGRLISNKAK